MEWQGWLLLFAVTAGTALVWYRIDRNKGGPSRCCGCGRCDRTGVCVLSGKPVKKGGGKP